MDEGKIIELLLKVATSVEGLSTSMDGMSRRFEDLEGRLLSLQSGQLDEITGCPFHPKRGTNGNKAISRIDTLEDTLMTNRAYIKGVWMGLGGLGLMQILLTTLLMWGNIQKLLAV